MIKCTHCNDSGLEPTGPIAFHDPCTVCKGLQRPAEAATAISLPDVGNGLGNVAGEVVDSVGDYMLFSAIGDVIGSVGSGVGDCVGAVCEAIGEGLSGL